MNLKDEDCEVDHVGIHTLHDVMTVAEEILKAFSNTLQFKLIIQLKCKYIAPFSRYTILMSISGQLVSDFVIMNVITANILYLISFFE